MQNSNLLADRTQASMATTGTTRAPSRHAPIGRARSMFFVAMLATVALFVVALSSGCGAPGVFYTPSSMVELNESRHSHYRFRATTPDGVVLAVRTIRQGQNKEVPAGSLDFWTEAVRLRLQTLGGYALLDEVEARSADGTVGTRLVFGHDQGDRPHRYWVTIYVTDRWVHVVEAGGVEEQFSAVDAEITQAMQRYRVRR